jgi:hypothetical protein
MKTSAFLLCTSFSLSALLFGQINPPLCIAGKTYTNPSITIEGPNAVIRHASGIARIPLASIPPEIVQTVKTGPADPTLHGDPSPEIRLACVRGKADPWPSDWAPSIAPSMALLEKGSYIGRILISSILTNGLAGKCRISDSSDAPLGIFDVFIETDPSNPIAGKPYAIDQIHTFRLRRMGNAEYPDGNRQRTVAKYRDIRLIAKALADPSFILPR